MASRYIPFAKIVINSVTYYFAPEDMVIYGAPMQGRLISIGAIKRSMTSANYGIQDIAQTEITLSDEDKALITLHNTYDFRTAPVTLGYYKVSAGTFPVTQDYQVDSVEWQDSGLRLGLVNINTNKWNATYPKHIADENTIYNMPAKDRGKRIPIIMGLWTFRNELILAREDTTADYYDYIIGYGPIGALFYNAIWDTPNMVSRELAGAFTAAGAVTYGTAESNGGNEQLVDSSKNFSSLGVVIGDIICNETDGTTATVTNVSSTYCDHDGAVSFIDTDDVYYIRNYEFYDGTQEFATGDTTDYTQYACEDSGADFVADGITQGDIVSNTDTGEWGFVDTVNTLYGTSWVTIVDKDGNDLELFAEASGEEYHIAPYRWNYGTGTSGYAFLRFKLEQKDGNGTYYNVYGDFNGLEESGSTFSSQADIWRNFMTNSWWGMGLTCDSTSFNAVETSMNTLNLDRGFRRAIAEPVQAIEIRRQMAFEARLSYMKETATTNYLYIDASYSATSSMTFDENNMILEKYYVASSQEFIKKVVVNYHTADQQALIFTKGYNPLKTYTAEASSPPDYGTTLDFTLDYTREDETADQLAWWILNKSRYQDKRIVFKTGLAALTLDVMNRITVSYTDLGISSALYQILEIEYHSDYVRITAGEYNSNIYGTTP